MTDIRIWAAGLGLALGVSASALAQPSAPWRTNSEPAAQPVGQSPTAQSELPRQQAPAPNTQPVINVQEVQAITREFQTQLNRLGGAGQITRCGPVLRLVTPQTGGFDESHGALCDLQLADRRTSIVMCDDSRGHEFTVSLAAIRDLDAIGRFIASNCFPEG